MSILVDTSIWVDYFRGTRTADALDLLIEENLVVTNQIILAELLPPLFIQNQKHLIELMREIKQYPMNIDWDDITQMRITCLKSGLNSIGIPDLIIAQNAIQGDMRLLSADKHFSLMAMHLPLALYQEEIA
jgi:hypothetical protein